MTSTDIATVNPESGLAPLWGGDDDITASDIKAPEIRITQGNSTAAQEGYARAGSIIFTYGSDDGSPTVLVGPGKNDPESFIGYVIGRTKFAATTTGGGLTYHPTPVRDMNDPGSWEGWFFYVSVPELDPILPARLQAWKSNAPAARAINGFIQRAKARGDFDPIPVRFSLVAAQNDKGSWHKYRVAQIAKDEVPAEELEIANAQRPMAAEMIAQRASYQASAASRVDSDQPEV